MQGEEVLAAAEDEASEQCGGIWLFDSPRLQLFDRLHEGALSGLELVEVEL